MTPHRSFQKAATLLREDRAGAQAKESGVNRLHPITHGCRRPARLAAATPTGGAICVANCSSMRSATSSGRHGRAELDDQIGGVREHAVRQQGRRHLVGVAVGNMQAAAVLFERETRGKLAVRDQVLHRAHDIPAQGGERGAPADPPPGRRCATGRCVRARVLPFQAAW